VRYRYDIEIVRTAEHTKLAHVASSELECLQSFQTQPCSRHAPLKPIGLATAHAPDSQKNSREHYLRRLSLGEIRENADFFVARTKSTINQLVASMLVVGLAQPELRISPSHLAVE
jgi:hypothetical protein